MIYDRIIFCHKEDIDNLFGGLRIFDNSNKCVLSQLTDELIDIPLEQTSSRWIKSLRTLKGIFRNYTKRDYINIIRQINPHKKILIFISHSQYGTLVRKIKKNFPYVIIATYFHNVEVTMAYNRLRYYKRPMPLFEIIRDYRSEKLVSKYSDEIFLLNSREASLFKKYYSDRLVNICSVALPDKCPSFVPRSHSGRLKLLFVGTYFWGNIPGVVSFIDNVMPYVEADFYVVGKDMEKVLHEVKQELSNVHYIGRVSDEELDSYYRNCDICIAPITAGGGMKTKVAEAMMYGLPVVGTSEAFCGYEIDIASMGYCSDKISDYKDFIIQVDQERSKIFSMSVCSRHYYIENYSVDNALNKYKSTLLKES